MPTCWINGQFSAESEARLSIFDRGVLFGDGIYEVAAVFQGRLLDVDLHLARLERSLGEVSLVAPESIGRIAEIMQELATRNRINEGLVYLQITRGEAERDFAFPAVEKPSMFAYARSRNLSGDPHAAGLSVRVVPDVRWLRCDIKSTSMLAQVLAKQSARAGGAYEAMMQRDGVVTEGGSSNMWIVKDGVLRTHPLSSDILAGITRRVVCGLAGEVGLAVDERAFSVEDAMAADECFLTSATSFVLPVTRIDDAAVGSGKPGGVTLRLREAYLARARRQTAGVESTGAAK